MSTDIFINNPTATDTPDHFGDGNLDGQMADGPVEVKQRLSEDYNQLDEPIMDTLLRDLTGIYQKMKIIALPLSSYDIYKVVLRGWDLWGPLLLCTFLAFNLHHSETYQDKHPGLQFANVFVLVWFGSCIVSLNYRLLSVSSVNNRMISKQVLQQTRQENQPTSGGDSGSDKVQSSSYGEQPLNTILSPPSIFQLMCVFGYCLVGPCLGLILLKIFSFNSLIFERIIVGLLFAFVWPTYCSIRILIRYQHPNKRILAIYPIGLFYFVLSCMIILSH